MSDEIWAQIQQKNQECEREAEAHGLYHRGWRFWPPYACFSCGEPISARQFAFARCCGSCDLGNSKTQRLLGFREVFVAGKAVLENADDKSLIEITLIPSHRRREYPTLHRPKPRIPKPLKPPKPRPRFNPRFRA